MDKTIQLVNGLEMPRLGFGTWKLQEGPEAKDSVAHALQVGYTHIDTAQIYGNEVSVGQVIKESSLDRGDIFLTTKVWNTNTTYQEAADTIDLSLEKLQTDYLDLLLIHWPNPKPVRENDGWIQRNAEVWRAMEDAYQAGKVKAIGVSNFQIHHLEELFKTAKIKPMVNQIVLAPGMTQDNLVNYCRDHNIVLEAYSPLGHGGIFDNQVILALSDKYGKTPAHLALAWSLQKGFVPLPKSKTPDNITANLDIFDIELAPEDMGVLDNLQGIIEMSDPDKTDF